LSKWKEELSLQHHLRAAANAICSAQHVGTVQAAYTLLKLPFVQSSRRVITINCERRSNMTKSIIFKKCELDSLDSETSAELKGLQSSLGRRHAYFTLVTQQRNLLGNDDRTCHVSLFALFTSYSLRERKYSENIPEPQLILLDENGFIKDPKRFSILDTVFTVNRKKLIVNMSPFVPVNLDDERFCWAMLLLHIPWPEEGESGIIRTGTTAVESLAAHLKSEANCPILLKNLIEKQGRSEAFLGGIDKSNEDNSSGDDSNIDDDDSMGNYETAFPTIKEDLSCNSFNSEDSEDDDRLAHLASQMEMKDIQLNSKHVKRISMNLFGKLENFIQQKRDEYWQKYSLANQIIRRTSEAVDDGNGDQRNPNIPVNDEKDRRILFEQKMKRLKGRQRAAFEVAMGHISGDIDEQLMMFMTGEGGTGKSEVIKLLVEYTQLYYGKQKGVFGSAIAMGPTGSSSRNVGGFTWQSVMRMSTGRNHIQSMNPTHQTRHNIGRDIEGIKFIVIDEVSLLSCDDLEVLEQRFRLSYLTTIFNEDERSKRSILPFAGVHVLFGGDFYQLPPVGAQPLYTDNNKKGRNLWVSMITKFVYLKKNFRLNDKNETTKQLAKCLTELRIGIVTKESLDLLNQRVAVTEQAIENKTRAKGCLWLAPKNDTVNKRNKLCFKELTDKGRNEFRRFFATHHQDSEQTRIDDHLELKLRSHDESGLLRPILDIAIGSRVRVVRNKASFLGLYNGALGTVVSFYFLKKIPKQRAPPKSFIGKQNDAIIMVQMDDVDISFGDGPPGLIPFARHQDYEHQIKINSRNYVRQQFPLECAHASTIHKAQGITLKNKDAAVMVEQRAVFMGGDYVAISRVTDLENLHLTRAVSANHFTSHQSFRERIAKEYQRLQPHHIVVPYDDDD